MTRSTRMICVLALLLPGIASGANACTDFQVKADDGTIVIARANEYAMDAHSQIVFEPAGKQFITNAPGGEKGLSWKSHYAYLGINGLGLEENFIEGMNEAGLSVEGLMFPEAVYETVDPNDEVKALSILDIGSWILGNFATISELKEQLPKIRVWGETIPGFSATLPLHFAVHDAAGNNIVIEFINGEKKVYDNPIGVMTNMPDLPWQITNLRNYLGIDAFNPPEKDFRGVALKPFSTATGWRLIPGDWSAPSRYVRIAYQVNMVSPVKDGNAALNLAKHILNTVDIPLGTIKAKMPPAGSIEAEYTQWSTLKDLTNRVLYYYAYDNMNIRAIDLKKLVSDHTANSKIITMAEGFAFTDMTNGMADKK